MQDKIDRLRQQAVPPQSLFINGRWQPAADGNVMAVISPIDGTQLTTIAAATAIDVDRAAAAARHSFEKAHGQSRTGGAQESPFENCRIDRAERP